ncbi:MAG: hypothetical protein MJ202_01595 [Lentisphaeria bacterium]|nr:hypothetical protein [Lentisphaeria bacterium]
MKIAIIGCTSKKETGAHKYKAIDLYSPSALFQKEVAYAQRVLKVDKIYILSAKYHLLKSDTEITTYNATLLKMGKEERLTWAEESFEQIQKEFSPENDQLFFLCGRKYYENLVSKLDNGRFNCSFPLAGKGGIGKVLHWLTEAVR